MARTLLILLALAAPVACAEPWLCTLPDGHKAFSYDPQSAADRACVDMPISRGYVRRAPPKDAYGAANPDFRIEPKTQKKRDVARREILERELDAERKALADALRQLSDLKQSRVEAPSVVKEYEERIRTHRTNIANLEKELARAG